MDFDSVSDDFFVNLSLQTTLPLSDSRETILHFCEAVQKEFPSMTSLYQRDGGEFVLEGDRESGSYKWLELQRNGMSAGFFNPPDADQAYRMHDWLLERSVYYLGISGLDVESLDVLFGFNLDFKGNRDAIVAQVLLGDSPLAALADNDSARPVECEPNMVVALDEDCYLQARISLETRPSSYQIRSGNYDEEPISIYFTVRQYPTPGSLIGTRESFSHQFEILKDYSRRIVIPQIVQPIAAAIATA